MTVTNAESGTQIDEIARGIYRISTPVAPSAQLPPGFSFNQILIAAEQPLLFHTGPRRAFPLVREAVRAVLPPETLRYIGFSHGEDDESGSLATPVRPPTSSPRADPWSSRVPIWTGRLVRAGRPGGRSSVSVWSVSRRTWCTRGRRRVTACW